MWNRILRILSNRKVMLRILITFLILLGFRLLAHITLPLIKTGITDEHYFQEGFLSILNNFSGQALQRMSIMSLGISPYITASIVVQMLQMVLPSFKEWSEQGEEGKAKTNKITRYIAIALAFLQGLLFINSYGERILQPIIVADKATLAGYSIYLALVMAGGTAMAIFIADLISKFGIGNGSSMLIVAGIVTSIPSMVSSTWSFFLIEKPYAQFFNVFWFVFLMILYIGIILGIVYIQISKRKVPIFYANRQGKSDSHIPMRLNSAGVIPVIFASTIMSIPLTIAGFLDKGDSGWLGQIFSSDQPIGFMLYITLIVIFSFFYSFMTIDPAKIAEDLSNKKANISGIRPGEDTKNFLAKLLFKITLIGTVFLVSLAALPIIITWVFGFGSYAGAIQIGGTSLLIVVGVAIETTQQIEVDAEKEEYTAIRGIFN